MPQTLTICQGLPGSGKTTWAEAYCLGNHSCVRVNKDDIRRELEKGGWVWSREREQEVVALRDKYIIEALEAGLSVVSDDTNLANKHVRRLEQIANDYGVIVVYKSFKEVSVAECIRRDSLREGKARVGEKVIREMARAYGLEDPVVFVPYVRPDSTRSSVIICDLDGTLALFKEKGHRGPYAQEEDLYAQDDLNEPIADLVRQITGDSYQDTFLYIVSGRFERFRQVSIDWLAMHSLYPDFAFFRPDGDTRNDAIIKYEIFDQHMRHLNVRFVLDDRDRVVKMWRSIGLTCLQVAEGDF